MNIQNLQAERTQLIYEFGEIEYEKRLLIQRLTQLKLDYETKMDSLKAIESQIDEVLTKEVTNFSEKNNE